MTDTRYVTQAETNKLIRAALRDAFPGIKFSVTGSGGNATNVSWTDGPAPEAVEEITGRFEGESFDGMTDMASPRFDLIDGQRVHYGASYVFTRRDFSEAMLDEARTELADAGIDPHGYNTLGALPASLMRHDRISRLVWNGYAADGALLCQTLAGIIADARWATYGTAAVTA